MTTILKGQNTDLRDNMEEIKWPKDFPEVEVMMEMIKKTINTSWKNNLTNDDVEKWLNNFTGKVYSEDTERRLALWMLVYYTYYNEKEINHLCRILYKNLIHDVAVREKIDTSNNMKNILDRMYFSAMGNAGESGSLLLYLFRQEAGISMDRFFYPTAMKEDKDGIAVFIDDVTLSGTTAARFYRENIAALKYKYIYYITLFASENAITRISKHNVKVLYATLLSDRDRSFSDKSMMFYHFPEIKDFAQKVAEEYGKIIEPEKPLGYKNGQFCFGFSYNTPNNTLPIFWSNKEGWYPLFPRKEKIYNVRRREDNFGKFI